MEDNVKIKVKNRAHCPVIYHVPEMHLRREFSGLEEKLISFEELRQAVGIKGVKKLFENDLIIKNKQAIEELDLHVEPEYFYELKDVVKLLTTGSMDEFLDCLDFAPDGVIDLIKEQAVELPLNDVAKREALLDKFDYNVDQIIRVRKQTIEGEEQNEKSTQRRAATPNADLSSSQGTKTGRRVVIKD